MTEISKIADLTPDKENARRHNERNVGMIVDALHEVGAARSIVIDEDGLILAGNATIEAAAVAGIERVQVVDADGETIVAVRRTGLTAEAKKRLALYDNRTAELAGWDADRLLADLESGLDLSGLFGKDELDELLAGLIDEPTDRKEEAHRTLTERFVVPPFSVLDARQGYWQERKRAWIGLGIQGELGRGMMEQSGNYRSDYGDYQPNFGAGKLEQRERESNQDGDAQRSYAKKAKVPPRGYGRCFGQDLMRGEHKVGSS